MNALVLSSLSFGQNSGLAHYWQALSCKAPSQAQKIKSWRHIFRKSSLQLNHNLRNLKSLSLHKHHLDTALKSAGTGACQLIELNCPLTGLGVWWIKVYSSEKSVSFPKRLILPYILVAGQKYPPKRQIRLQNPYSSPNFFIKSDVAKKKVSLNLPL